MEDPNTTDPDKTLVNPISPSKIIDTTSSPPFVKPQDDDIPPAKTLIPASPTPSDPPVPIEDPAHRMLQIQEAKRLHEADLEKHTYNAPRPDRLQDDWQATYVWAFIVRFGQREKIRKLECMDDFERCLTEPVANRPDDIFEGILIRFLTNLKPGLRNLDPTNIQSQVSSYVHEMLLNSPEFTVWDRPWAPHEEARGPCCNSSDERLQLGTLRYKGENHSERTEKNPIKIVEGKGGGLFELDWFERSKLLRQLVDWQLTHSDTIHAMIKPNESRSKAKKGETYEDYIDKEEPLGLDRNKNRIWALDHSGRLFKSGNPFKRPCPLVAFGSTISQLTEKSAQYAEYGAEPATRPKGSGSKGRLSKVDEAKYKKLVMGKDNERALAERIDALIPLIEKEEARVQRQKKKVAAAVQLAQMAEVRSTRTRRPTRKVDYSYNDDPDDEPPVKRSRRGSPEYEATTTRGRPTIPGERRSLRFNPQDADTVSSNGDVPGPSHSGTRDGSPATDVPDSAVIGSETSGEGKGKGKKGMKGYAWVEEYVPPSTLGEGLVGVKDEEEGRDGTGEGVKAEVERAGQINGANGHTKANGHTITTDDETRKTEGVQGQPIEVD